MKLLVECLDDTASMNIAARLRELVDWEELGLFEGRRILAHGELRMITIEDEHITNENLHVRLPPSLQDPEVIVFLSRHRAKSGTPSLTVHPIGNWNQAPYGGKEGVVIPTAPFLMGGLLRFLKEHAPDGYEVTMEATHHGPYIEAPTLFLELGSSEEQWDDEAAAKVLARSVLEHELLDAGSVLWVGGGHYCPQLTDLVLAGKVAPGHVIAGWATSKAISDKTLQQAIEGIPGCKGFILQRNATVAEQAVAEQLEALGLKPIDAASL